MFLWKKTDWVELSIWIPERKHLMKHLSNAFVERLHCSLGDEVQADSRIHREGEKKVLKSLECNSHEAQ